MKLFDMTFDFKRDWSMFFAFLIIVSLVLGVIVLNNDKNKLEQENQEQHEEIESIINDLNTLTEQYNQKEKEYTIIEEALNQTSKDLEQSQLNISFLQSEINEFETNQTFLLGEVEFYEGVIGIIGTDDVESILIAYGMQAKELEELEKQYEILLQEYNDLLDQQS